MGVEYILAAIGRSTITRVRNNSRSLVLLVIMVHQAHFFS